MLDVSRTCRKRTLSWAFSPSSNRRRSRVWCFTQRRCVFFCLRVVRAGNSQSARRTSEDFPSHRSPELALIAVRILAATSFLRIGYLPIVARGDFVVFVYSTPNLVCPRRTERREAIEVSVVNSRGMSFFDPRFLAVPFPRTGPWKNKNRERSALKNKC